MRNRGELLAVEQEPRDTLVPDVERSSSDDVQPTEHSRERRERSRRLVGRIGRALGGCALSTLVAAGASGDISVPPPPPIFKAASSEIVNEGGVCPPDSQFGVWHVPGVGMGSVSVHAARQTETLLGEDFDECEAGLRFNTNYNRSANTELLHEFVVENELDTIVVFAYSFGAIAGIDSINDYVRKYPDAKTKFAVIFFSSPGDINDLQPLNWAAAQTLAQISINEGIIEAMTYLSTLSQGDKWFLDPQVLHDVEVNTVDTPPTAVQDETKRLVKGIERLPDELDAPLYYIGDVRDQVVKIEQAVTTIKRLTGKDIISVRRLNLVSGRMSYHADLWWPENFDVYKPSVKEDLLDALNRLGVSAKAPEYTGHCSMWRLSCR